MSDKNLTCVVVLNGTGTFFFKRGGTADQRYPHKTERKESRRAAAIALTDAIKVGRLELLKVASQPETGKGIRTKARDRSGNTCALLRP